MSAPTSNPSGRCETAPAPVLGMAAADAAPGGGLLCAEAGVGASARVKATPIKVKIVLRIVISPPVCLAGDAASIARFPWFGLVADIGPP